MKTLLIVTCLLVLVSCGTMPKQVVSAYKKRVFKTRQQIKRDCFNRNFRVLGLNSNEAIRACRYILSN